MPLDIFIRLLSRGFLACIYLQLRTLHVALRPCLGQPSLRWYAQELPDSAISSIGCCLLLVDISKTLERMLQARDSLHAPVLIIVGCMCNQQNPSSESHLYPWVKRDVVALGQVVSGRCAPGSMGSGKAMALPFSSNNLHPRGSGERCTICLG